jgi:hypothetical protein
MAALLAYPFLPRQITTMFWGGPMVALLFNDPANLVPGTHDKAWIFTLPITALAMHAPLRLVPLPSGLRFIMLLCTGLLAYLQCSLVWSAYNGPIDLSRSIIALTWFGLLHLSLIIISFYKAVRAMVNLFRLLAVLATPVIVMLARRSALTEPQIPDVLYLITASGRDTGIRMRAPPAVVESSSCGN